MTHNSPPGASTCATIEGLRGEKYFPAAVIGNRLIIAIWNFPS
jgi:hypothetical protein